MTQKELLYVEDAIKHENSIISILESSTNYLEDEKLVEFIYSEEKKHKSILEKLLNKLEECSNE